MSGAGLHSTYSIGRYLCGCNFGGGELVSIDVLSKVVIVVIIVQKADDGCRRCTCCSSYAFRFCGQGLVCHRRL